MNYLQDLPLPLWWTILGITIVGALTSLGWSLHCLIQWYYARKSETHKHKSTTLPVMKPSQWHHHPVKEKRNGTQP